MNWNFAVVRGLARLTFAQQLILLAMLPAMVATLVAITVLTRQHLDNLTELMRANAQTVATSTYVVQPGDTLRGIGNRTGAGSEAIARANGLTPPFAIRIGQKLTIPGGRYHLVAEGETGIAIASAYGVAWSRIVAANGLTEPFMLRRGQRLLLPGEAPATAPSLEQRAAAFHIDIDDVLTGAPLSLSD